MEYLLLLGNIVILGISPKLVSMRIMEYLLLLGNVIILGISPKLVSMRIMEYLLFQRILDAHTAGSVMFYDSLIGPVNISSRYIIHLSFAYICQVISYQLIHSLDTAYMYVQANYSLYYIINY